MIELRSDMSWHQRIMIFNAHETYCGSPNEISANHMRDAKMCTNVRAAMALMLIMILFIIVI